MRVREALAEAEQRLREAVVAAPKMDAELLLRSVLGWDRMQLRTRWDSEISAAQYTDFAGLIRQRKTHRPMQHILGVQEFYGWQFRVTPDVLIPRPETELLVEAALQRIDALQQTLCADIGTGSGAIAVTLCTERPNVRVLATDSSSAALEIAKENARTHGVEDRCEMLHADLLPGDTISLDLIASNPPYVVTGETLPREVREFEPQSALFAGPDGLAMYRRIIPLAAERLKPGGWLLLELGAGQGAAVVDMLAGWRDISVTPDLQGIPRVLAARSCR